MTNSPEVDMDKLTTDATAQLKDVADGEAKTEIVPVAFGLNALKLMFVMDEFKGSTDALEENLKKVEGVQSVEVTDVRRAMG